MTSQPAHEEFSPAERDGVDQSTVTARGAAMDILAGIELAPVKDFDRKVEVRAEKREHLRGRNNATSCRSPTRELDTRLIKNELKKKRQLEFLRRRSVSPELCGPSSRIKPSPRTFSVTRHSSSSKLQTFHSNIQTTPTANGHPKMILTPDSGEMDGPSSSTWASLWPEQVTLMRQEKGHSRKQASTSTTVTMESKQHRTNREKSINAQKTNIKTLIRTENIQQKSSHQTENILQKKTLREAGVQTESGLVTVKESDVKRLADYLQEALWREEAMKKKLAALQESTSNLLNSSNIVWTARCSEDLLRNKIKVLESQLQVCLQKFPKDGVKKLVVQMEKQKLIYEEKALVALQKATQEKTEAVSKAETLQGSLITAKAEALRWQSLYEELKLSSGQLRENQHLSNEQLQQLHSQVELSRAREAGLREEVGLLRQEKKDLQYNIRLLEEDNQVLREESEQLRDGDNESQDFMMQDCLTSEEAESQLTPRRDTQAEEQLRYTEEKLRLKERECEELQTELHAMEQECQSSQARLSQCRDELRQLSHRRRKPTPSGSWWRVFMFFLLLLAVAGVAMLWLWHPPFREQVEDLYSDIETRIEDYLLEMASPQHSGCFRPI
ncbi:TRAF3-interacting JNK-activating modulator-like isoform X2 [Seriola lalandi dorsalis]|uniref:TRAF3-interacting JNK-activating modulator-like isoform X2 n=1 Tax=Seriola lalandi dorsalis TaxID=1841481 RepID=UPI000C6F9D1E|nr:TRAF3-interacting JNK-activating modulator-like isoform X2 [Seriola lalandi dorsalis]XP_056239856.1 TRAF3-interacting JNK-activating modulator isoform X4 [Seriola aureovittata]